LWRILGDRHGIGHAICGAGAREHESIDIVQARPVEQIDRPGHIVAIVERRLLHRFADQRECREMHHSHRLVLPERLVEPVGVENVT